MLIKKSKILEANQVCFPCGEKYGNRPFPTHNFSVWGGVCDICGHESNAHGLNGGVTSVRDFGYLHEYENNEQWKDVVGYEGLYQVSTFGRIKSIKNSREKILVKRKSGSIKYYTICLCKNNKPKYYLIHRLVASAFIPNIDINKDQVNHKNGNKLDNRMDNLEWVTNLENRKHSYNK